MDEVHIVGVRKDLNFTYRFKKPSHPFVSIKEFLREACEKEKFYVRHMWRNRRVELKSPGKANHQMSVGASRYEAIKQIYAKAKMTSEFVKKIIPAAILYGDTPSGLPRQQDKIYSIYGISPTIATFSTPCFNFGEEDASGWRQLSPEECLLLQGFPGVFKRHKNDNKAIKQAGNAVTVNVAEDVIYNLLVQAKESIAGLPAHLAG